jgi:hypothetical protein
VQGLDRQRYALTAADAKRDTDERAGLLAAFYVAQCLRRKDF